MNERLSVIIKTMRFPLIILVVFIHELSVEVHRLHLSLDGWNLFHCFSELISQNIARMAVPMFFIISGFLFFIRYQDRPMQLPDFKNQWAKRIRTLLIPYLSWNILYVIAILVKRLIFTKLGFENDDKYSLLSGGLGYIFWTGPIDYPLWYIRDLIVVTLLAPVYYYVIKKNRILFLAYLGILYLIPVKFSFLPVTALLFFGIGAFLSVDKVDILALCRRMKIISYLVSPAFLGITLCYNGYSFHFWLLRLACPFWCIAFFNIMDSLCDKENIKEKLISLEKPVFFIYAIHVIYIIDWTRSLCLSLFGAGVSGAWLSYLLITPIVISICILLYRLLEKTVPQVLSVLCGNRI